MNECSSWCELFRVLEKGVWKAEEEEEEEGIPEQFTNVTVENQILCELCGEL